MGWLTTAARSTGIPAVLCGPGSDTEALVTDEWIAVDQLDRCTAFLDAVIAYARSA